MATLADYEDEIEQTKAGAGNAGLTDLPDGKYEFAFVKATYKQVKTGAELVDIQIEVVSDGPQFGKKFQHTYWLTETAEKGGGLNKVSLGILRKDLKTLGFDEDQWTRANGRPFLEELKKALRVIEKGVQFTGTKKKSGNFAQLYIDARSATDGMPAKFGPAEMNAAVEKGFDADADY